MKTLRKGLLTALFGAALALAAAASPQVEEPAASSPASVLGAFQQRIHQVAEATMPAVVQIDVVEIIRQPIPEGVRPEDFFSDPTSPEERQEGEREYRRSGLGSGVIVRRDGDTVYVLTNNHVIGGAEEISLRLASGQTAPATLVGRDPRKDIALLSFTSATPVQVAVLGSASELQVGDWVLAAGSPLGLESSLTAGIVSALGRQGGPGGNISDFIQTDAVINPGNSGGPLINLEGEVVGINTWIASTTGNYMGFGFAIPIDHIRRNLDELILYGRALYGWLGVTVRDLSPEELQRLGAAAPAGALVTNVYLPSPARQAGLRPGDLITSFNGQEIPSAERLILEVGDTAPGQRTALLVDRYGASVAVSATTGTREEDPQLALRNSDLWPGLVADWEQPAEQGPGQEGAQAAQEGEAAPQEGRPPAAAGQAGVVALAVYRGTPAYAAGLRTGDRITGVNGRTLESLADYYRSLAEVGQPLDLQALRGGRALELTIPALGPGSTDR